MWERRIRTSLVATCALVLLVAASAIPAQAWTGSTKAGELELVIEESGELQISGDTYSAAPGLQIIGPAGETVSIDALGEHQASRVVFSVRHGRPYPLVTKMRVIADGDD